MSNKRTLTYYFLAAIYTSILTNKLATNVPKYVAPAATSVGLPTSSLPGLFTGISTGSFANVSGITSEILVAIAEPIKTAYARSFSTVFLATIGFSCLLVGSALLSPNVEDYLTSEVARKFVHGGQVSENSSDSRKDIESQSPQ
jgi:hypothetical protein